MNPRFIRFYCWCVLFVSASLGASAFGEPASSVSVPRFTHPGAGQIFYFALTDRFANGSTDNDAGHITGGPEISGFDPTRISHYHGGDFAGLTQKLDYIKHLGATAVWVTPPFKNKPMQSGTAGYHGYWVLDFMHIDPHLGTDAEFDEFVRQAHARRLKVYMDIIVNHTADVISYREGSTDYVDRTTSPYRDARGERFDERAIAYNGLNSTDSFPELSTERSFPHVPVIASAEEHSKNPGWLNDPRHYHNRGNSLFRGENSLYGDFVGLDDLFTEQPDVVRGFIEIYSHWIDEHGVDGFRIDTAKHVNLEFWQAFAPAIREEARRHERPGFIQFGEVSTDIGDVPLLSAFSTDGLLDTTLDFGFFRAARRFVSQGHDAGELADFFALDDYYTDHVGNAHTTTTFLGNHDAGRFVYFLKKDNPAISAGQLSGLVKLGHALLFLARGQPVLYYGDEQGMIGRGGDDMQAREDMFASKATDFKNAPLLETTRTGADDKFDENHPFFRAFRELADLRHENPALSRGAMIVRPTGNPNLFVFSRVERREQVEYLIALNSSRVTPLKVRVPTSQPAEEEFDFLLGSPSTGDQQPKILRSDATGNVTLSLAPLQYQVWRARHILGIKTGEIHVSIAEPAAEAILSISTRQIDGHVLPIRQEILAEVTGGDNVNEVTFAMTRASRPGQYELLGVDDAPPYRIFWHPPPDLAENETISFIATVNNLRGTTQSARINGIKVSGQGIPAFGVRGATVPRFTRALPRSVTLADNEPLALSIAVDGSGPFHYCWLVDGEEIPNANDPTLSVLRARPGHYRVAVRGLVGTLLSDEVDVIRR